VLFYKINVVLRGYLEFKAQKFVIFVRKEKQKKHKFHAAEPTEVIMISK